MRDIIKSRMWQLFLVIALLSMQMASAHIHLASEHTHDGHGHAHAQLLHSHHINTHHVDAFDEVDHEDHSSQVVELSQEGIFKYGKCLGDLEQTILAAEIFLGNLSLPERAYYVIKAVHHAPYYFSKLRARAPPKAFTSHL